MKKIALLTATFFALATLASAQMSMEKEKPQRPSPAASAQCKFSDGKTIKTDYSSPRAKGRKIFGDAADKPVVPYGQVWRTGANEATTFVTIPNADKWTLIINKKTAEWGIPYKYEADELGRFDMKVSKTPAPVENFTIAFDQGGTKCTLRLEWDNTQATIDITK